MTRLERLACAAGLVVAAPFAGAYLALSYGGLLYGYALVAAYHALQRGRR